LIRSNKYKLKNIIINPETIDKICEFFNRKLPRKLAVAPRQIKTSENPRENINDLLRIKFLDLEFNSLRVVPHIKETYPGIRGNTQGEKKLIIPAKKAIESDTIIKLI
jgi:hypothetical protein